MLGALRDAAAAGSEKGNLHIATVERERTEPSNLAVETDTMEHEKNDLLNMKFTAWETGLFLSKSERKFRNEIRKQIAANPNSLNFINKVFKNTRSIKHPLMKSFKEKIILEVKAKGAFEDLKDSAIDHCIEEEVIRILRKYY